METLTKWPIPPRDCTAIAGCPAGGDLRGTYPAPVIADRAITPAKLATVPAARARSTTPLWVPHDTTTFLPLNTVRFDTAGLHGAGPENSRLTAPIDGTYVVSGHVGWGCGNPGGYRALSIAATLGLEFTYIAANRIAAIGAWTQELMSVTTVFRLEAGNYVQLAVRQTSGDDLAIVVGWDDSPHLAMTWVGPA